MKTNEFQYKGYTGTVGWSEDDKYFYGKVLGITKLISYEGHDIDELRRSFIDTIDSYLENCKRNNMIPEKPYRGSFNVRVDPKLHKLAVERAYKEEITLNKVVIDAIKAYLRQQ